MSDEALLLGAGVAVGLGMICLALSLPAHWRQFFGARPQTGAMRTILRGAGAAALLAGLFCCLRADSAAMAVLLFTMMLAAAALATALALSVQSARAAPSRRSGGGRPYAGDEGLD